jgi:cysteine desulfurase
VKLHAFSSSASSGCGYLADREIYVSSGSACSKGKASHVLTAMGLPRERIASSLRLSFSRYNTKDDIDCFIEALKSGLSELTKRPL